MKINWRKTSIGNYAGRSGKRYFFISKRPHGGWCAEIRENKEVTFMEGYFAASIPTINKAKKWCLNPLQS